MSISNRRAQKFHISFKHPIAISIPSSRFISPTPSLPKLLALFKHCKHTSSGYLPMQSNFFLKTAHRDKNKFTFSIRLLRLLVNFTHRKITDGCSSVILIAIIFLPHASSLLFCRCYCLSWREGCENKELVKLELVKPLSQHSLAIPLSHCFVIKSILKNIEDFQGFFGREAIRINNTQFSNP